MIELPEREDALCFNINDKPGTILNLVRDPKSGQPGAFKKKKKKKKKDNFVLQEKCEKTTNSECYYFQALW